MKRLFVLVLGLAMLVAGAVMAAVALSALVRQLSGPVEAKDLTLLSGQLSRVSPCSTGRNARFEYVVTAADGAVIESGAACPSSHQAELSARVGTAVSIRYLRLREVFFLQRVMVYEMTAADRPLWTFEETRAAEDAGRLLTTALLAVGSVAGLAFFVRGWHHLRAG